MKNPIYINSTGVISSLDYSFNEPRSAIRELDGELVAPISLNHQTAITELQTAHKLYAQLDRSVLLAILAARKLQIGKKKVGVNIGSSRGATGVWEDSFIRFRESGITPTQSSPLTTLGNISTWIAQDLGIDALAFSHSITCATASHAILNGVAWLESNMVDQFIAGGSEAPLTPFTIAQMKVMRIYALEKQKYPCRALDSQKKNNTMVLGEAAACFLLSKKETNNTLGKIVGYGTAIEQLTTSTSMSSDGKCFQESMKQAVANHDLNNIDVIITHAPGTIKGDRAELQAIKKVFGNHHPALCNNKWQIGHTLGASSAMSVYMALEMFKNGVIYDIPYLDKKVTQPRGEHQEPKLILVNATGFGGNAVSLLLEK